MLRVISQYIGFDELDAVRLLMQHADMTQQEAMEHLPILRSVEKRRRSKGQVFDVENFARQLGSVGNLEQAGEIPGVQEDLNPKPPRLKYHPGRVK